MGKRRKKAAKASGSSAEVESTKKICSNCGNVGGSVKKNLSKCAFCEFTIMFERLPEGSLEGKIDERPSNRGA